MYKRVFIAGVTGMVGYHLVDFPHEKIDCSPSLDKVS